MDEHKMIEVRADDLAEIMGIVGATRGFDGFRHYSRISDIMRRHKVPRVKYEHTHEGNFRRAD